MKSLIALKTLMAVAALAALLPVSVQAQSGLSAGIDPQLADNSAPGSLDAAGIESRVNEDGFTEVLAEVTVGDARRDPLAAYLQGALGIVAQVLDSTAPNMARVWVRQDDLNLLRTELDNVLPGAFISAYREPVANSGQIDSGATQTLKADIYHELDVRGQGVTIALMDIGYAGLVGLAAEAGMSNEEATKLDDGTGSSHGTAMLEVLHDMAPDAQLLAYRLDAGLDIYTATQDAINRGADVIVCPLSWFELPGEGVASDAARLATGNGIHWVSAAGNFGDRAYWEAQSPAITTINGAYYLSMSSSSIDPVQPINDIAAGESFSVHFAYELDPSTPAALALELLRTDVDGNEFLIAEGDPLAPVQTIAATSDGSSSYFVRVRMDTIGSLARMRMFVPGQQFGHSNTDGSVANPATIEEVITVGSVNQNDLTEGAPVDAESSHGGGLWNLPMDLCGLSMSTTGTYGPQGFSGTSCAAGNFAGLLALQLSDIGLRDDPLNLLHFIDVGQPGDDLASGKGVAQAFVDEMESDNDMARAVEIPEFASTVARSISPSTDRDFYTVNLAPAQILSVDTMGDPCHLLLLNASGMRIADGDSLLSHQVGEKGQYFLQVTSLDGFTVFEYNITFEAHDGPPLAVKLLSPANGDKVSVKPLTRDGSSHTVAFAWTEAVSAQQPVYIAEVAADPDFKKVVTSNKAEATKIEISGLELATYYWRVKAVSELGESDYSEVSRFTIVEESEDIGGDIGEGPEPATEDGSQSEEQSGACTAHGSGRGLALLLIGVVLAAGLKRRGSRRIARQEV